MRRLVFSLVVIGTVGLSAGVSPSPVPSPSPSPNLSIPLPGEIWINELLANPVGSDTGQEWIELRNRTARTLQIGGLTVSRLSGSTLLTVPAGTTLAPDQHLKLDATGSVINGGDTILLKQGSLELDRITYDASGEEGESWARITAGEGAWTATPTPGALNAVVDPEEELAESAASATASSASTKPKAAKATAAKKSTASAAAKKLPASGPDPLAYGLPVLLGTLYWYGRKYRRHRAGKLG